MFTLTNVRFKTILAIDDLTIRDKVVTGIVGRSGSGKTTLLRLLNKMISPDAGEIRFHNTPLADIPSVDLRRRVVMLSQIPVMYDGSIRDNILIGREFAEREPLPDEAMTELLNHVSLAKRLDDSAANLSGGEKQRVAIARVLAMQPEVLLLDEPTSALDEGTEHDVVACIVAAGRQRGISIVMVTHARAMATEFADDLIELDAGRVVDRRALR